MAGGGMIAVQETPVVRTTIGQGFIDKQSPIANSLQTLRLAPGVNVGQDSPLGISERSDLSVRGLSQLQMGFVVEGVPAGDPAAYTPNTNAWADGENTAAVTITPGTSDLSSPVIGASGGLVDMRLRDPSHELGGTLSLSAGSFSARRAFARLETGDLNDNGLRGFVSYSYTRGDNWRGPGFSDRHHVDLKIVNDWSDRAKTTLLFQYNKMYNERSRIVTLPQFQQFGSSFNYVTDYTFGETQYYKYYPYGHTFWVLALPTQVDAGKVKLSIVPYYRNLYQFSQGAALLNPLSLFNGNTLATVTNLPYQQGGRFTALTVAQTPQTEAGVNANATLALGNHKLTLGLWYDYLNVAFTGQFRGINQDGSVASGFLQVASGGTLANINYKFRRNVMVAYAADEVSLLDDRLKLLFGIKYFSADVSGNNFLPGATPTANVLKVAWTPRVGMTFKFGEHSQIFADLVTNARPPTAGSTYFDTYNVTTGGKSFSSNTDVPFEYSFMQEVGYRYQSYVNFSVAAFHNVLYNNQVNTLISQNGALLQSSISGGKKEIFGANVEIGLRPWHNFSPYISGQYLHAETKDNLPSGNDFLPTAGKVAIRSPRWQGAAGVTYDDGKLFSTASIRVVSSQYSTFMNDETLPGYHQLDFGLGYRLPNIGFVKRPTVQVNLSNVFGKPYLGSIATPTLNALPTVGTKGTLIGASSPGYYESAGFAAIFTLKSDF
ncbi:MAG: TonB-dependent receptor [Bradyrhizobium sp.]|nr:TonB-dependent receptor [Bradyrhizobium sp.]